MICESLHRSNIFCMHLYNTLNSRSVVFVFLNQKIVFILTLLDKCEDLTANDVGFSIVTDYYERFLDDSTHIGAQISENIRRSLFAISSTDVINSFIQMCGMGHTPV